MYLDTRGDQVVYVEINGWTFCIDDSTDEQIVEKWENNTTDVPTYRAKWVIEN